MICLDELRQATLAYVAENPVKRGRSVLLSGLKEEWEGEERIDGERSAFDVHGWFLDIESQSMHRVFFIEADETYDITVFFGSLEPVVVVDRIEITVDLKWDRREKTKGEGN